MNHFNKNYEKNIQALKNIDIVLATKIIQSGLGQSFELTTISEDHQLYNILDHMHERALYKDIVNELQSQIKKLKSQINNPFVYLFGIGNGYTLPILLQNSNHKRITLFEVELELLFVTFHIYDFSKDILSRRLRLFSHKSFSFAQSVYLFKEHQALHHARSFELIPTADYYTKHFNEAFTSLNELLLQAFSYHLSLIRPLETQLSFLDNQHNNLPMQLLQSRLESFENIKNATAIIINQKLNKQKIKELQSIKDRLTIICSNNYVNELISHNILPDIVITCQNNPDIWKDIPTDIQENIIEFFVNYLENFSTVNHKTKKLIGHLPFESYFENQTDQKVNYHESELTLALETSYLLGHTQSIIIDDTIKHENTLSFQNLAFLISFYKEKMQTTLATESKIEQLECHFKSFSTIIKSLEKQNLSKQHIELDTFDEDIIESKQYRQDLKTKHLLNMSLLLLEYLQASLQKIQPWYEALDNLEEDALLSHYSDAEMALHIDTIAEIRQGIEQDSSYQKFYHDFLHPTTFLTYIEMATIQSLSTLTPLENRSKNMQWAIINYQWLNQLYHSVDSTIELLKKQLA